MDSRDWVTVHEIKGTNGIAVRIQRRGDRRPQYSFQLGRERKTDPDEPAFDKLLSFVPVMENFGTFDRQAEKLVKDALDWIEQDARTFAAKIRADAPEPPKPLPPKDNRTRWENKVRHDKRGRGRGDD